MLIATLPTLTRSTDEERIREILAHPSVMSARYNTGGETPLAPTAIMEILSRVATKCKKTIWIDLDGRQLRLAEWSLFARGSAKLNRAIRLVLPAKVFFRGTGWFDVTGISKDGTVIYFDPPKRRGEYFLGVSQSVHVVGESVEVLGEYLSARDHEYLAAACAHRMSGFMLSFVEGMEDIAAFNRAYVGYCSASFGENFREPTLIAKIESKKGVECVSRTASALTDAHIRLMAARDDLYLNYVDARSDFLSALKIIIGADPGAIVASKILTGLEWGDTPTLADLSDIALMWKLGYREFMLADELSGRIALVANEWEETILPMLND